MPWEYELWLAPNGFAHINCQCIRNMFMKRQMQRGNINIPSVLQVKSLE